MQAYINIKTGEILDEEEIKKRFPAIVFGDILNVEGALQSMFHDVVITTDKPTCTFKQIVTFKPVVKNADGVYEQIWTIEDLPAEEFAVKLQEAKDVQWNKVKVERERLYLDGVFVQGKWFETDTTSLLKYLSLASLGDLLPEGIEWKTMDNSFITMTPALAKELHVTAIVSNNTIFQTSETIYSMIKESEDPESIDITDGWPVSYSSKK